MKSIFLILSISVLVVLGNVDINEKDRKIEELIRQGIEDPMFLESFSLTPGNGVLRVNQKVYNVKVTGLGKAEVNLKSDLGAGYVYFSYYAKRLKVYVDYVVDGQCLLIPIWGKGKGVVTMDGPRASVNATVANVGGKYKITNMDVSFDVSGGSFSLSSLFGERHTGFLTKLFVSALNTDAKYVFNEILPSYMPPSEARFLKAWKLIIENV